MPIVTIQALPPNKSTNVDQLLAQVVKRLAAALETVPSNVWANFNPMAAVREGDSVNDPGAYHPIVTVLANSRPEELVSKGLEEVAKAVAEGLGVPLERVWVRWIALNPGDVFADGARK